MYRKHECDALFRLISIVRTFPFEHEDAKNEAMQVLGRVEVKIQDDKVEGFSTSILFKALVAVANNLHNELTFGNFERFLRTSPLLYDIKPYLVRRMPHVSGIDLNAKYGNKPKVVYKVIMKEFQYLMNFVIVRARGSIGTIDNLIITNEKRETQNG